MTDVDLLTPADVAEALDCTIETVQAKLVARQLPGIKIGRSWRLPRAALVEHLNEMARRHLTAPAPQPVAVGVPVQRGRRQRVLPRLVDMGAGIQGNVNDGGR